MAFSWYGIVALAVFLIRGSLAWALDEPRCTDFGSHRLLQSRFVRGEVFSSLKRKWRKQASAISAAVLRESERFCLDPLLLLALIQTESRFNPLARGSHGEIGLMQIKPRTARWIAGLHGIRWRGKNSLKNPVTNIRLGTAYFAHLQKKFHAPQHYVLAAYNAGPSRVSEIVSLNPLEIDPRSYPGKVLGHYEQLLSRYSQLRLTADAT